MDKNTIEHFKSKLLSERERQENMVSLMKRHDTGEQDRFSGGEELSNYDNHPADLGTEVFLTELGNGLIVNHENSIKSIDDALNRISNGTYGICKICGQPIDNERLEIVPFTENCASCSKSNDLEVYSDYTMRPVEEKVIDAPFGRKYLNKQEDDEYEGVDYLNDLQKYGSSDTPQDLGGYHDYKEYYTNEIDNQGIVDETDKISNDEYKRQINYETEEES